MNHSKGILLLML